jgi:cytohesin
MATTAQQMLAAVLAGDVEAVATLLEADPQLADLVDRSADRRSVLHHAARLGSVPVVELLLAAGATPDKRAHDGSTPLYEAAAAGHLEVVRLLVRAGADPGARTNGGHGPWSAASHHGHRAVAEFLRAVRLGDDRREAPGRR